MRRPNRCSASRGFATQRAIVLDAPDADAPASRVLQLREVEVPVCGPHEVRVRVSACAVCHRDVLDRTGAFPFIKRPSVLGHEIAGVVEAVGDAVSEHACAVGDRVVSLHWAPCMHCRACLDGRTTHCSNARESFFGLTTDGGYASTVTNGATAFVKAPPGWSAVEAAPVMCTFGTVWHGALTRGRLAPGEHVLVTGASGGVGSAAVQIAAALGCRVTAVTSSTAKVEALHELGATDVIVDGEEGDGRPWHAHPSVRASGGVDMAFEAVGGPTFGSSLRTLREGGRLVLIGNVTNSAAKLPLGLPIIKGLEIIGSDSVTANELERCFAFLDAQGIRPVVSDVLPLEDAAVAHDMLEARQVSGRIILSVGEEW